MKHIIHIIVFSLIFLVGTNAQSASGTDSTSELPIAFLISEDDKAYGDLVANTPMLLLEVCNDSMNEAYKKWIYMLADMEDAAEKEGFDIKGIKIWINVFWNADGSIDHIVYYPKPYSKNIDYSLLTNFFNSFSKNYKLEIESSADFAHYGSASFPTFIEQLFPERKK